jgi:hypothetical protein
MLRKLIMLFCAGGAQREREGGAMWMKRSGIVALVVSPILLISSAGVGAASRQPIPPSVTVQPVSTTADLGHLAHFKARATGFPRPTYQWQVSTGGGTFVDLGVSTPNLSVEATFATDGNRYRAVISNPEATVDTQPASLTVDQSQYLGQYTLNFTVAMHASNGGILTLLPDGQASDGTTLDFVFWSASGRTVTVRDGNDAGELLTFVGNLSKYGIASPKHPGTVALTFGGGGGLPGTFYAQRIG